jgi:nitrate reductase gamma subunit
MSYLFLIVVPYAAAIVFLAGIVWRVALWASAPVPFRIPTTCGQQRSLSWIKSSRLDNPHTTLGVLGRMALEILLFRSLFRNTKADLKEGPAFVYGSAKWLWLGAMAFHWSLSIILARHLRFFIEPEPRLISLLQNFDGFFQVGIPVLFASDALFAMALIYLFIRRLVDRKLRYISLAADYFPLLLLGAIAATGILMRHIYKVDLLKVKELTIDLVRLHPSAAQGIGLLFYIHLLLVCLLISYFPFGKLVHMAGIFLSPTRNLANTNRMRRHVNPWNYDVPVHTYEEYEDEFRPVMQAAGLPVEKEERAKT